MAAESNSDESISSTTPDAAPESKTEPSAIPNGGFAAWLQVLGAHLLFFNSWGIINTFGAYQTYYESELLRHNSSSEISWIGTFQGFLLTVFCIATGPIFDRGYYRPMLAVGTFLVVFGMMMTSIATEYWQVFLAQGLCTGLGTSCIFLPSVAIVATYFSTKRALATGIVAAGGSIGSVIYPIVFHRLQPQIGFGWATRVIGFLALFGLAISLVIMKTRLPPVKKSRSLIDTAAFRSPLFVLFCFGVFFVFVGLYIPFYYIIDYAQYKVGVSEDLSFYFLCVINAASAFGRIIPGLLADRLGSLEVITICTLATTVLAYVWIAIDNLGGIIVFCILYGFFSGAVVSLPPTVVASLAPELELVGTWVGMCFGFAGLGFLIGNPIAGTLISIEDRQFTHGIIFAASMVAAAAVFFVSVELIRLGFISVRSSKRRLAEPQ